MTVRWATAADIDELVRLRQVMFESMGETRLSPAEEEAVAAALREGLSTGAFFAAVVDGDGFLAACGVGMEARRVPGPGNPSGRWGYIQSMVTDDRARRRGLARVVLTALLDRFVAVGVTRVELHASVMGEPLYRSMGFVESTQPELSWSAG